MGLRTTLALAALLSLATAQTRTFSTVGDIVPSATASISGPIQTNRACAQIQDVVRESDDSAPIVPAELAYACLQSVPFLSSPASYVISDLKNMVQFQSNLAYLRSPPRAYVNKPVDILAGLDDIDVKIKNGTYKNEYNFEADIAELFSKSYDGHLSFEGMAYSGAFAWRRVREIALISASLDGKAPKIWAVQDFNKTGFTPSAITHIEGRNVVEYLEQESQQHQYHDPDARYNVLFYMPSAGAFGRFVSPSVYPGPSTTVTFENGTTRNFVNNAIIQDPEVWQYIGSGRTFYQTYIIPSGAKRKLKKRSPNALPLKLEHPKDITLSSYPPSFPEPVIAHSAEDVPLAAYFINTAVGETGVLVIQTFNTPDASSAEEFQLVIQEFLAQCLKRRTKKVVIDLRGNGGGKILLGYDAFKQFFPKEEPQLMSRYRGHDASQVIGESISSYRTLTVLNGDFYSSPFNYNAYLDKDLKAFNSWQDMYPPDTFNKDKFTSLLRYNLSDPITTSSQRFSIGISITGYQDRSNFTTAPFDKDDIIILTDGICSSTCTLFTELMIQQAGVKAITLGGRPQPGPMQVVGGTKGSLVLSHKYLTQLGQYVIANFAQTSTQLRNWTSFIPTSDFSINYNDASINFQDTIRKGLEADGVPTQFLNDSSACRMWFTPNMYLNATELWSEVARTAWGDEGKLDEDRCVRGSVTTVEQQQGEGNTENGPSGTAKPEKSKGAAAGAVFSPTGGESWRLLLGCAAVVFVSFGFGASLI